ncbi:MAG: hypothetical protein LC808_07980 [Actinobacteria bacterium]|nr:hypothetical protein [Actinomycetota bacterium]
MSSGLGVLTLSVFVVFAVGGRGWLGVGVEGLLCGWVAVVVSRVVEGKACGLPVMLPGGAVEARGSRVPRSGIALATPEAPLTWEGRPRRLRGTTAATHPHNARVPWTPTLGGTLFKGWERGVVCSWGSSGGVGWHAPGRFPGCGQTRYGVVGHPFAARGGMECCDRCARLGSIRGGDSPPGWGS